MAAGCPAKCAKILLIIFNIIFWVAGAVLCAIGIWLLVDDSILQSFNIIYVDGGDKWFEYAAYVMIAVGAFTLITGFLGCFGAIKESPCLLGTYIALLVFVMMVEIAVGVLAFVFRKKIEEEVAKTLGKIWVGTNYTDGIGPTGNVEYTGFGTAMNLLQQQFECCGIDDPKDYYAVRDSSVFPNGFPYSCCKLAKDKDKATPQLSNIVGTCNVPAYTTGCGDAVTVWLEKNAVILIGLGIGVACLEIFGIIFAVCVCRNPSKEDYE